MRDRISVWIGERAATPLGTVWAAVSAKGLWAVSYDVSEEDFRRQVQSRGLVKIVRDQAKVADSLDQLAEYLNGEREQFDLKIDWCGMSDFDTTVRQMVLDIPYGEMRSYGEIAKRLGKLNAARAVGRANATNPMPLVIPCHRVIGSDGSLRGYGGRGGVKTKAWLLELEGAYLV